MSNFLIVFPIITTPPTLNLFLENAFSKSCFLSSTILEVHTYGSPGKELIKFQINQIKKVTFEHKSLTHCLLGLCIPWESLPENLSILCFFCGQYTLTPHRILVHLLILFSRIFLGLSLENMILYFLFP